MGVGLGLGLALVLATPMARAGEPDPRETACNDKSAGDGCSLPNGDEGTCTEETCNRLDYSQGSPPKSIPEPCMVCNPKESGTSAVSPTSESQSAGSKGEDPPKTGAKCNVGDGADSSPLALALVGLGLAIAGLGRRRRRCS